MNLRAAALTGVAIGSFAGSLLPLVWGGGYFSFASVLWSAIGGIIGIYIAYKLVRG